MSEEAYLVYRFGAFWLDPTKRKLVRGGEPMSVTPKGLDTLILLVQNRSRVLEKDELMQALWPQSFVEESNLSQLIFLLRKILGDDRNGNSFIQTVPRRGYKFIATVQETDALALKNDLPAAPGTSLLSYWSQHSPFRSLQVFEPEDAWLFFGRESETHDLLARLGRAPALVVVGNSGSGKSSLVRAGLIAALREKRSGNENSPDEIWRIAVFRPSGAPFDYLAEILPSQLAPELGLEEQTGFMADCRNKFPGGGDALRNAICTLTNTVAATANTHVLLVADQFEEIFTLTANSEERIRYIDLLLRASRLDKSLPVHLVFVLRADFYAQCLEHAELAQCLEANLYNVPRMTPARLREAIEKRLQLAAAHAEPGLIDSLLEDVGAEPGNLALLEHALGRLWEHGGGPGCTLTNQAYVEIGRLKGALGRHADAVYQRLGDEKQQGLARRILLELVHLGEGAQDTRRRVAKTELLGLGKAQDVEALLAHLTSSRLISTGRAGQETFVEISHEALIREWPALSEWLTVNREELSLERRVQQQAEEWQRLNHDADALLKGTRLAQAEDWLATHPNAPTQLRHFLHASVAARAEAAHKVRESQERELARQKATAVRLRWFSGALAAMLLVVMGATWFAYHQQVLLESRALAAHSGELLLRDHGGALNLAIRSWHTARTEEARIAVAKALPDPLIILKHEGPVVDVNFSPDGQRIVSASYDHTARIWNAADGRLLITLQGHTDKVNSAAFSPNGQLIVTSSDDKTARVWNGADGRLLFTLQGHSDRLTQATFAPDGRRILTTSHDHTARVWNVADGRLLATLQGHTNTVGGAALSPDGQRIVTSGWDHTARVWNSADGSLLRTLPHASEIIQAVFSPDNQRIFTASMDKVVRVWNSVDGRLLFTLQHDGPVLGVLLSSDGRRILTGSADHTARIWNSVNGRLLFRMQHEGPLSTIEFSRDNRLIVTASLDHTARVWDATDGRLLAVLQGHADAVNQASFSPDSRRIATGSGDGTVRIWNLASGLTLAVLRGHTGWVNVTAFSGDGQRVVTAGYDHAARLWNTGDGSPLPSLNGHTGEILDAQFSPEGQRIVTASRDHTARVWDTTNGRLLFALQGHTDAVQIAQFSPDGHRIVTASHDHTARLWDATDGRLLVVLKGHTDAIRFAQFSPDGARIITTGPDKTARVWNAADGRLLTTLQYPADPIYVAQFSGDGRRVLTLSQERVVRVWNAADGRLLFASILQQSAVRFSAVRFSPNDQFIVGAGEDHVARVWKIADGQLMAVLTGHTDELYNMQFSPDSQRIVTASKDHTARLWSVADGRLLATLQGHWNWVVQANFSPDGQHIITASTDQTARLWQMLTLDDIDRMLAK